MTKEEIKDFCDMKASLEPENEDIYKAIVKALEQEPKWIPVTERLPEEKTAVLLSCDDMYLAKLNPCIGWTNGNN